MYNRRLMSNWVSSSYSEMDGPEKNKISQRGKALAKLQEWLARELRA